MQALSTSSACVGALVRPSHRFKGIDNGLSSSPCSITTFTGLNLQRRRNHGAIPCRSASSLRIFAADTSSVKTVKWLLQPIGDGDCSHLDEAVPLPGAIELVLDSATVGRVAERADIVIPIATVSGLHARLEKKGETLFVTDLDSTNGTYINDRQLRPGAVTPVPPGSRVTFGDDHLAAFKFSKEEEPAM
ncbi:hypothetical protein KP509_08G030800 [Ceratopteris richardii]|uniref:FHA domain-containing protein n=1 Tax=Ceratopteris richardii TaxID=49495 RepID=A0A8T2UCX7_CERRI|nr:hypothetical protein KP509_08G030800 [Ceratopteris richardii]KAH7431123.1 hypothetical protein KP509_08G030800 [Ceratopteris richardii]KAH7431124.1 hypothetical protein KP509_08G030800 [Ceratopteris richardii]KAH7431125.1 hypothetical protein KP509_08G030800 [Ceratopteris richardii]